MKWVKRNEYSGREVYFLQARRSRGWAAKLVPYDPVNDPDQKGIDAMLPVGERKPRWFLGVFGETRQSYVSGNKKELMALARTIVTLKG